VDFAGLLHSLSYVLNFNYFPIMPISQPLRSRMLLSGLLLLSSVAAQAQEYHNTTERINDTYASGATTVVFGPNADITINSDWYLTASSVTIDPAARIGGTGTLHIMTPATYGAAPAATVLNAGGVMGSGTGIGCRVSLENGSTITLAGSNNLVLSNTLAFAKAGAHLILGSRNVVFTAAAAAIPTAAPPAAPGFSNQPADATTDFRSAYVVTSGTGRMTKAGVTSSFSFPVGFSASNDLNQAQITNTAGATRAYTVGVSDYATSASLETNTAAGNGRTWIITSDTTGAATLALQDNVGTVAGSYNPAAAFITQQTTPGFWDVSTPVAATTPTYTHTRTNMNLPATIGNGAYFSKSSDATNGLSTGTFTAQLKVFLQGAMASGNASMTASLRTGNLIPALQPYNYAPLNFIGSESSTSLPATMTDWVLVELRSGSNPATVVATRAGMLLQNGTIVDLDGTSGLSFRGVDAGSYYVAIRHRNHLAIRTPNSITVPLGGTINYDFTTAQSQAFQSGAPNAAQVAVGSNFAMWGGNANGNSAVNYGALGSDRLFLLNTSPSTSKVLSGLGGSSSASLPSRYSNSDLNMNGTVNYGALGSDRIFLLNTVLGGNSSASRTSNL
jgi:hypothetical protein